VTVPSSHDVTLMLQAWTAGDQSVLEKLTPLVEAELRRLAHHYLARERSDHTLQTTGLINEAWLRLIDWKQVSWQNRAHFFGVSARLMRHILVGFARTPPFPLTAVMTWSRLTTRCGRWRDTTRASVRLSSCVSSVD
jgi:hypothetical protein